MRGMRAILTEGQDKGSNFEVSAKLTVSGNEFHKPT